MEDAIASYHCVPDDGDFSLSEDLFCTVIRTHRIQMEFIHLVGQAQDARAVHIIRHIPASWIHKDIRVYNRIAMQAMLQESFAVLEEVLPVFMNLRHSPRNMRSFFEDLLKSGSRDCIGLMLRTATYKKLHYLKTKGVNDWLLEQLVSCDVHWCIPYLRGLVNDTNRYEQALCHHRKDIMDTVVT